ncbi:hypothetical protein ABRQ22_17250 [Cellulosimicrobium sp. ES-005]|uniref:DUF3168 domain-containing protein n=1 Tax=Cellulosimicrobium sp. ES-005 TaxID=3163031 RepID=A0AAU8G0R5_9MICO
MTSQAFAAAVLALMPAGIVVYDGQAVTGANVPAPPWAFVTISFPDRWERTLASPSVLRRTLVQISAVGDTTVQARFVADKVDAALEGARPAISGWSTTGLRMVNSRPPEQDRDVTITTTNLHPMVGVLEYEFTASVIS